MSDLTYTYLHMTHRDLLILDTFENAQTYLSGEISDEELEIPPQMVPPNPDDSDILPSQVHPSYPYGNPTNIRHPASRPRINYNPASRALFEDFRGGGVNGSLTWKDLALDRLLPVDREKEENERAAQARKLASGASSNNNPPAQRGPEPDAPGNTQTTEGDDETSTEEEDENEEGDGDEDEDDDEDEEMNENSENYDASFDD